MHEIFLYDSLSRRRVRLEPRVPGQMSMYVCGLTVQDAPHAGHARFAVAFDVWRRFLAWRGYRVRFVMNLTDVDDKIIRRAAERGVTPETLAEASIAALHREMEALGMSPPDVEPRVTEHVPQIVDLTRRLVDSGHAYEAAGSVYFSVASFPAYGALSGQSTAALRSGARVEVDAEKRSALDFALWKAAKAGEPSWPSPWGPGRPGWHIECSAMALEHLGEAFDIHGGGLDLVFPHHENETAQSHAALGPGSFARAWLHNGLLEVGGEKMSKSTGNFWLLSDLRRRHDAEAVRLFLVAHHYRASVPFEVAGEGPAAHVPAIADAERRLEYLYATLGRIDDALALVPDPGEGPVAGEAESFLPSFDAALSDDLNTPAALASVGEALRAANRLLDAQDLSPTVRVRSLRRIARDVRAAASSVLGLLGRAPAAFEAARRDRLAAERGIDAAEVDRIVEEREAARRSRDFERADALRRTLDAQGVQVLDGPRGATWRLREGAAEVGRGGIQEG